MLPETYYVNAMTNLEELVLLCVYRMGDEGYPAIIYKLVNQVRETKTSEGEIRRTINRFVRLGFVEDVGTPTGRGTRKMRITSRGKEVLALIEERRKCILEVCQTREYNRTTK